MVPNAFFEEDKETYEQGQISFQKTNPGLVLALYSSTEVTGQDISLST